MARQAVRLVSPNEDAITEAALSRAALLDPTVRSVLAAAQQVTDPFIRATLLSRAGARAQGNLVLERLVNRLPQEARGPARDVWRLHQANPNMPVETFNRIATQAMPPTEAEKLTLTKARLDVENAQNAAAADTAATDYLKTSLGLDINAPVIPGAAKAVIGLARSKKLATFRTGLGKQDDESADELTPAQNIYFRILDSSKGSFVEKYRKARLRVLQQFGPQGLAELPQMNVEALKTPEERAVDAAAEIVTQAQRAGTPMTIERLINAFVEEGFLREEAESLAQRAFRQARKR